MDITWDNTTQIIDGRSYKIGRLFDPENKSAPARVKCDLQKMEELYEAGLPIDDAITLERLA